jgi:hypothetical protein
MRQAAASIRSPFDARKTPHRRFSEVMSKGRAAALVRQASRGDRFAINWGKFS